MTLNKSYSNKIRRLLIATIFGVASMIPGESFAQFMIQNNEVQINEESLVSWFFGNQTTEEAVRKDLDNRLKTNVHMISQACYLRPDQQERIILAGEGDVHRYFTDYKALRRTIPIGNVSMEKYQEIWQEIQPMRTRYTQGLHTKNSLYMKSIPYVLDKEQLAQFEEFQRRRFQRKYKSLVIGSIALLEKEIPLTDLQRTKVVGMLLEKTPEFHIEQMNYYHMYLVFYQMSKLPEERLKPIFLENEWKAMKQLMQQAQQYEQTLKQQGVLF